MVSTTIAENWGQCTRAKPCPICESTHYCSVSDDGAVASCMNISSGAFKSADTQIGTAHYHRLRDDSPFKYNGQAKRTKSKGETKTFMSADGLVADIARQVRGVFIKTWPYHDANNNEVMRICRFSIDGGADKTIRPIHESKDGWRQGDPPLEKLPLYRLPHLNGQQRLYVLEGETCCDAAVSLELDATCSSHGAKSANKTDWTVIADRELIILPDNDAEGKHYAEDVAAIIAKLNPSATIKIVELPGLSGKGDIVDYIASMDDIEPQRLKATIDALAERRAGEILKDMAKAGKREGRGGDRKSKGTEGSLKTLQYLSVTRHESKRWQKLADAYDALPCYPPRHSGVPCASSRHLRCAPLSRKRGLMLSAAQPRAWVRAYCAAR